jgi:O-antigen ligase
LQKGANISFYFLVLLSLISIAGRVKYFGKSFLQISKGHWPLMLAMAGNFFAIFFNHLLTGNFISNEYDLPSRLAFFGLIFWVLLLIPGATFKQIHWGLPVGLFITAIEFYTETHAGAFRPPRIASTPIIPLGNMALLSGILIILSIGWNKCNEKIIIILKIIAGGAGMYASLLSQARGGWIAIPLFLLISYPLCKHWHIRYKLLITTTIVATILAIGSQSIIIQDRIMAAKVDITDYATGKSINTSLGVRWQLWQASWKIFSEHPITGVGANNFPTAIQKMVEKNAISPIAAMQPHSHNDILYKMATLGLLGGLAMLSMYFAPAFYFFKKIRDPDQETRTTASMGLTLCLGFFIFGLSDTMFFWTTSNTFYSVILAGLAAHLVKRNNEIKQAVTISNKTTTSFSMQTLAP